VDIGCTIFFVISHSHPARSVGGERGEDGTTGPDGVVSVRRSDDLDLRLGINSAENVLLKSLRKTRVQSRTTGEDDVGVEILSDVEIASLDGLDCEAAHAESLATFNDFRGLEQGLRSEEAGRVDNDRRAIGQLVLRLVHFAVLRLSMLFFKVLGNEADLLLESGNDLEPGALSTLFEDILVIKALHHELRDFSTSGEVLIDGVGDLEALEDGNSVSDTVTGVDDETSGTAIGVKRKDSLNRDGEARNLECLEHHLCHLLSVRLGVAGSLSEHDILLGGIDSEFIIEAVLPDFLHVVPIGDDTGLDGIAEVEDTSHLLSLITNVVGLTFDTDHRLVASWDADNGWEFDCWDIFTRDTGLEDTRSVIDNNTACHFVVVCFVFYVGCV